MKKSGFILLMVFALWGCDTVRFKQVGLYDKYEKTPEAEREVLKIFSEAKGTMWNSLEDCGDFEITREASHSGNSSIKLSWDKGKGCEWIGFGNSFSNWTAMDMSEERKKRALSFYVRTQSKTAKAVPIVAAMEDFSGGGSYHFVDAGKYLYGLTVDTTWKRMIVPLWDFPIREDEVDIYSIKQMQFQLEGAGSFFLDDIELIDYSPEEYAKMRAEVELMKPKGKVNQIVYQEGKFMYDAWGHENNKCQVLEEREDPKQGKHIYWKFDPKDCSWAKWGMNWNDWYQVNFRGILDQAKLSFKLKTDGKATFNIGLQDYKGHSTTVFSNETDAGNHSTWTLVEVPLAGLNLPAKKFTLDMIKQFTFHGKVAGEVQLDDIKITEI